MKQLSPFDNHSFKYRPMLSSHYWTYILVWGFDAGYNAACGKNPLDHLKTYYVE